MGNSEWLSGYNLDSGLVNKITAPAYPIIAWNLAEASWVAEVDRCDEFDVILPWPEEEVVFGKGSKKTRKQCYVTASGEFAILAERTRWYDRTSGERVPGYQEGAYSKLHLLALVRDATAAPVVLTIKGVSAGELAKQLTQLRRSTIATARRKLGQPNLSEAAFWLTIRAGKPMMVGAAQQTEITPPLVDLPGKADDLADWLGKRFIGPAALAIVNGLAEEIRTWRDADGADHGGHDEDPQEPAPAPATNGTAYEDPHEEPPTEPYRLGPADRFWGRVGELGLASHPLVSGLAQSAVQSADWDWAIASLDRLSPGGKTQVG